MHGDPSNKPMTAVPNNDFVVIDTELQHSWGWVQAAVATKNVAAAGTYDVKVTAKNSIGLVRTDSTTNELTIAIPARVRP